MGSEILMNFYSNEIFSLPTKALYAAAVEEDRFGEVISYLLSQIFDQGAKVSDDQKACLCDLYELAGIVPNAIYYRSILFSSGDRQVCDWGFHAFGEPLNLGNSDSGARFIRSAVDLGLWAGYFQLRELRNGCDQTLTYWTSLCEIVFDLEEYLYLLWVLVVIRISLPEGDLGIHPFFYDYCDAVRVALGNPAFIPKVTVQAVGELRDLLCSDLEISSFRLAANNLFEAIRLGGAESGSIV